MKATFRIPAKGHVVEWPSAPVPSQDEVLTYPAKVCDHNVCTYKSTCKFPLRFAIGHSSSWCVTDDTVGGSAVELISVIPDEGEVIPDWLLQYTPNFKPDPSDTNPWYL